MKTKSFLIGSLAWCFASVAFAQNLPQIPATKASWEFGLNYGGGARSFQAVQGASASKNLPNGLGMFMLNYQLVFNNKWLLAAEMGFLGENSNKKHHYSGSSNYQYKNSDIGAAQATLMAGYNLLNHDNWRLFGVAGFGGGSVALNPSVYGSNGNFDNRQNFSTFQVGLMGQYLVKLGSPRAYSTHARRGNCCCCCCNKQQPEPDQKVEAPKRYMQWVMPITVSLTFHKARNHDQNQLNQAVTAIAGQEGEPANLSLLPTNSYYQNFSGVSLAMYIGFGGQRRNAVID